MKKNPQRHSKLVNNSWYGIPTRKIELTLPGFHSTFCAKFRLVNFRTPSRNKKPVCNYSCNYGILLSQTIERTCPEPWTEGWDSLLFPSLVLQGAPIHPRPWTKQRFPRLRTEWLQLRSLALFGSQCYMVQERRFLRSLACTTALTKGLRYALFVGVLGATRFPNISNEQWRSSTNSGDQPYFCQIQSTLDYWNPYNRIALVIGTIWKKTFQFPYVLYTFWLS